MKYKAPSLIISLLLYLAGSSALHADEVKAPANTTKINDPDSCIKCHDEDSEFPVFDIFQTKHAMKADSRTPFAGLQCEACHGPGIIGFGAKSDAPVAMQNRMCLKCHEKNDRIAWRGSKHENADVACASCHTVHAPHDAVLDKQTQAEQCYDCHQKKRADFFKPSNHPVRFGQLACSDCHATHGSSTPSLLGRPTLNQTCYTCHAEKRGPFLWEHAPASEDCTLCHTPHGSIHPALLKKRAPLLCQQCHSQAGHPSLPQTAAGLPGGSPSGALLAGSCTNCHSQVHGSNHPSGVKLMR
jgi:DmsE family decaheme c-type cytochrome